MSRGTTVSMALALALKAVAAPAVASQELLARPLEAVPEPSPLPRWDRQPAWPRPGSRSASSVGSAQGRRLSNQQCSFGVMEELEPVSFSSWKSCVGAKKETSDFTIAGMDLAVEAECWCEHDMKEAVERLGCCHHERYDHWCELDCQADCSSQAAQTCLAECPALCLEQHYAPEECAESCTAHNCHVYRLCITEHAKNQTLSGLMDKVCDDARWERSREVHDYVSCMSSVPQRTHWNYWNAYHHCICRADVRNATVENHCCDARWSGSICNETICSAAEERCGTAEAQSCATECSEVCTEIVEPSTECKEKCLLPGGRCYGYQYCQPAEWQMFDYICNDASEPDKGGCCTYDHNDAKHCPWLCDDTVAWQLDHGIECVCTGCPSTTSEQQQKLEEVVRPQVELRAEVYMDDILALVGLTTATPRMLEMMEQRNAEILAAYGQHINNPALLQSDIHDINSKWLGEIQNEALRCQAAGDCYSDVSGIEQRSENWLVTGVLVALGVLSCCAVVVWIAKKSPERAPDAAQPNVDANLDVEGIGAGADNVVLGRPVNMTSSGPAAAGVALPGAPPSGQAIGKDPDDPQSSAGPVVAVGRPVAGHTTDPEKQQKGS